ncbi:sce7725 family protein [Treponema zuelzerae]|uniref:Sce7725 family protein n=1 Tax=Teretinema zuelzerae TaxID=156 RepID=A0AAE3JIG9_9SPIR|nr:sce7725 family protein [Teretinema zuelzerae]MCD1655182.1 sce7725 family protein [Teretinema zuelzerae]
MYYPYLRGRQYELIALREMLEHDLLGTNIIPIIEPVKASSTLISTLESFVEKKKEVIVIQNPMAGSFSSEISRKAPYKEKYEKQSNDANIIPAFLVEPKSANLLGPFVEKETKDTLLISNDIDTLPFLKSLQNSPRITAFVIPDESTFRKNISANKISLGDHFKKRVKNSLYSEITDEFFTHDHLSFREDGYSGYSDFSIIGDDYTENGFAPYAVAIHMVYFDMEKNLRVHHFVSDTNGDIYDTAGKFAEALFKLVEFDELETCNTYAIRIFRELYEGQEYPGLGTVKKLAIMHHLELIKQYFDNVN